MDINCRTPPNKCPHASCMRQKLCLSCCNNSSSTLIQICEYVSSVLCQNSCMTVRVITAQIDIIILLFSFRLAHQGPVVLTFEEDDLEATELVVSQVDSFHKSAKNTVLQPSHLFTAMWYFLNIMLLYSTFSLNVSISFIFPCSVIIQLLCNKTYA